MTHHAIARKDPRQASEMGLHMFTAQLLRLQCAKGVVWYHVPNGEARSKATGAKLKCMGVRPGVGDFALVLAGGKAAFLELKRPGGRPSAEQRLFRADAETAGALYAVASTPEQAQDILASWGALRPVSNRSVQGRAA